jgi:hypothetical protein
VLVIVHAAARVLGGSPAGRSPGVPGGDPVLARAVAVARRRLDRDRIQPVLRSGAAGEALVDLAFAEDILALGAPTHRRWSGSRSATRFVLGHASCPVVVVPSRSSLVQRRAGLTGRTGPRFPGHVVVGVHRPEAAHALLAFGFAYAARHRLPLAAVQVTRESPLTGESAAARLLTEQLKSFEREQPHVVVRRWDVAGEVGGCLVPASDGAALLVAGAAARGVGPVVRELVDHGLCPVAVVRPRSGS